MSELVAIRHVAFEDLGIFGEVLEGRGYKIRYVDAAGGQLRQIGAADADLLVVLGGPIGAYEEDAYPFLTQELRLLEQRLRLDLPVLGICLGSQLMARALGARVFPGEIKEIGWSPLQLTQAGREGALGRLSSPVLHWHGDTFDLPQGATLLASSDCYRHQAFQWGRGALGLQFHAEVTAPGLEYWLVGHAAEIAATPGLSVAQLRRDTAEYAQRLRHAGRQFFEAWLDEVLAERRP